MTREKKRVRNCVPSTWTRIKFRFFMLMRVTVSSSCIGRVTFRPAGDKNQKSQLTWSIRTAGWRKIWKIHEGHSRIGDIWSVKFLKNKPSLLSSAPPICSMCPVKSYVVVRCCQAPCVAFHDGSWITGSCPSFRFSVTKQPTIKVCISSVYRLGFIWCLELWR